MNIEQLIEERKYLQEVVTEATQRLLSAPEGQVYTKEINGVIRYYRMLNNSYEYLSIKKKRKLLEALIQKKRDLKSVRLIPEQIKAIDNFINAYKPTLLNEINSKYPAINRDPGFLDFCKSVSDASTERGRPADDTDLARNLISICEAFLKSKGC